MTIDKAEKELSEKYNCEVRIKVKQMEQIDWTSYCYEEKDTNWDRYYEAMAEKDDLEWEEKERCQI